MRYPRHLAIKIYTQILDKPQQKIEVLVESVVATEKLNADQAAWLRDVCAGMLRWNGRIEVILSHYATKKKPSGRLAKYLTLAIYQILGQERTNPVYVVDETVSLIKNLDGKTPAAFVNALLRKVVEHKEKWLNFGWHDLDESRYLVASSLPHWIWKRVYEQRGKTWAQGFADSCLQRPVHFARVKGDSSPLWGQPGQVPASFKVEASGDIAKLAGYEEGLFFIQDISSQFLVHEVSSYLNSQDLSKTKILDLCSAPGGKSMGLALNGFQVFATDHNVERMRRFEQNIKRMQLSDRITILPYDETVFHNDYALTWVDAPCTGTGTLRRHPEIPYQRSEKELQMLIKIQQELLGKAVSYQKSQGLILYSVCSVLKEEGEEQIKRLKNCQIIRQWDLAPHQAPFGDGFYAALLQIQ